MRVAWSREEDFPRFCTDFTGLGRPAVAVGYMELPVESGGSETYDTSL